MAVREILQIGHPTLLQRAEPVPEKDITTDRVQDWITDLIDTMRDANGAGLAANQIGIPYRLFVIEVKDNPRYPYKPKIPLTVVINPEIEFLNEKTFSSNEGCLSVPQMRGHVDRYLQIRVRYFNQFTVPVEQDIQGYSACTWQHEYDHLNGVLFPHRVSDPTTFMSWQVFQTYHQNNYANEVKKLVETWGA